MDVILRKKTSFLAMLSQDSSIFNHVEKFTEYKPLHKKNKKSANIIFFSDDKNTSSQKLDKLANGFILDCEIKSGVATYSLTRTVYKKHDIFYIYKANGKILGITEEIQDAKDIIRNEIKSIIDSEFNGKEYILDTKMYTIKQSKLEHLYKLSCDSNSMENTIHPKTILDEIYNINDSSIKNPVLHNISSNIYLNAYHKKYVAEYLKKYMPVFLRSVRKGIYHWGQTYFSCSFASLLNAYQCKDIDDFANRVMPNSPNFSIKNWVKDCLNSRGTDVKLLIDNFSVGRMFVITSEQDVYNSDMPDRAIIYENKHFYAFIKKHDRLLIIDSQKSYIEENHSSNRNINAFAREYFINKIKNNSTFTIIELK